MKQMHTWMAIACLGTAMSAQASVLNDALVDLADQNGLAQADIQFDFNDLSVSTLIGGGDVEVGDVIEGVFTIDSISLKDGNGSFIDELVLANTDIEVFGRYQLTVGSVSAPFITMSAADFEIFEDDRADGVRSVIGLTGSGAYNNANWGGAGGIVNGSMWGMLDINSGGSYELTQLSNGDLAVVPELDVVDAGLPINDPVLGIIPPVTGTGTVTPTAIDGEFNNRASFSVGANVPEPAAAVLLGLATVMLTIRPARQA